MAWIIGLASPREIQVLRCRGWKLEDVTPADPYYSKPTRTPRNDRTVRIFVDNDLFNVLSGPDWDIAPDFIQTSEELENADPAQNARRFQKLLCKTAARGDPEPLDELVHDIAGSEAANVNNGGCEAQLAYLVRMMGLDAVEHELI